MTTTMMKLDDCFHLRISSSFSFLYWWMILAFWVPNKLITRTSSATTSYFLDVDRKRYSFTSMENLVVVFCVFVCRGGGEGQGKGPSRWISFVVKVIFTDKTRDKLHTI